jgi:hypothetical protein
MNKDTQVKSIILNFCDYLYYNKGFNNIMLKNNIISWLNKYKVNNSIEPSIEENIRNIVLYKFINNDNNKYHTDKFRLYFLVDYTDLK